MILVKPSFEILNAPVNLELIELAARTCYKSEHKLGTNPNFLLNIIKSGHESVIEHLNVTVKFIIDRGVSHELVRHRLCAFSQESTRYCNYKGGVTFVIPPWVNISTGEYSEETTAPGTIQKDWSRPDYLWWRSCWFAEDKYTTLLKEGWSLQQARSVLPNSLKTEIIVTANLREWRHILKLRTSERAHPQMREIMIPLQEELRKMYPTMFIFEVATKEKSWTGISTL